MSNSSNGKLQICCLCEMRPALNKKTNENVHVTVEKWSKGVRRCIVEEVSIQPKHSRPERQCSTKSSTRRGATWFQAIVNILDSSAHVFLCIDGHDKMTSIDGVMKKKAIQMASKSTTFCLNETTLHKDDVSEREPEVRKYRKQVCYFLYAFYWTEPKKRAMLQVHCSQVSTWPKFAEFALDKNLFDFVLR